MAGNITKIYVDVYLIPYQLFTKKILNIYIELMNPKITFQLAFLNEVLNYYK